MRLKERIARGERGSVILEASLVFPLVLLVMLAFSVLIRYLVVYETMQHGLYETTREMGAYYYLYADLGFEKLSNGISGTADDATKNLDMLAEPLNKTINNMRNISSQLGQAKGTLGEVSADFNMTDVDSIRDSVDALQKKAESLEDNLDSVLTEGEDMLGNLQDSGAALQLIAQSPLEALTYLLKTGAGQLAQWAQNGVMNLVAQAFLSKHIPGGDLANYARAYGITNFHSAMCWNNHQSGDVEMVLTYTFRIRLFGGVEFQVIQKTSTKGWGLGV